MAFEIDRLKNIGGSDNREFGGNIFSYTPSNDDIAAVSGVGFFNDAFQQFQPDDQIILFSAEGLINMKVVSSLESGVVVNAGANGLKSLRVQISAGTPPPDAEVIEIETSAANSIVLTGPGFLNQEIILIMTEDAGDATVTFDPASAYLTSIVFSAITQSATLKYMEASSGFANGWSLIALGGKTNPVIT